MKYTLFLIFGGLALSSPVHAQSIWGTISHAAAALLGIFH